MPSITVRTVAARSVAAELVEVATQPSAFEDVELVGPEMSNLAEQARRLVAARAVRRRVLPVPPIGRLARQLNTGVLYNSASARSIGPTFEEWLNSRDCTTLDL